MIFMILLITWTLGPCYKKVQLYNIDKVDGIVKRTLYSEKDMDSFYAEYGYKPNSEKFDNIG